LNSDLLKHDRQQTVRL